MKKNIWFPFLVIIVLGVMIYFMFFKDNNEKQNPIDNKVDEKIDCEDGYTCEKINNTIYKWSNKKSIKVNKTFNYDTDEMEVGTLEINEDGILKFYNLQNTELKEYTNIDGKVLSIDSVSEECDKVFYVALTSDGKVYRTDTNEGLLIEEPFFEIELNEEDVIKNISVVKSYESDTCTTGIIYGKTSNNTVIELS